MAYKLIFAIINTMDRHTIIDALISRGYHATQLNSIGGFSCKENISLVVIVPEDKVSDVVTTIKENSVSHKLDVSKERADLLPEGIDRGELLSAKLTGTVVAVLPVDRFVHLSEFFDSQL